MGYASTDLLLWANFWSLFDHYSRKNIQKVTKNAFAVSCCKRLYHAKFHNSHKDAKITKRLSIPVRVTRRKSPEWLYKAVRGILYFRKSSFDHCLIIILRCLIFIGCRFALQVGIRVAFRATISPDFQHIGNWVQVHFPSKNIYGSAFLILGIMSILPNIVGSLRPVQKFGSSGALLEGGCAWWFGRIGRDYRL